MKAWAIGLLALGAGAAVGAAAAASTRRRGLAGFNAKTPVHPAIEPEIHDAEMRARSAGARGELDYIGAGAEGIVFCDAHGKAFKVARHGGDHLTNEAEWFAMAAKIPSIKQYVPKFARYNAAQRVLVRECLTPRPYVSHHAKGKRLWDVHDRVARAMAEYGYGRPEFKEDSWVYTRRGPVIVDAGFAIRRGNPLVRDALAVANGRRQLKPQAVRDLAWELRMERGSTIPAPVANRLLKRLQAIEPGVEID